MNLYNCSTYAIDPAYRPLDCRCSAQELYLECLVAMALLVSSSSPIWHLRCSDHCSHLRRVHSTWARASRLRVPERYVVAIVVGIGGIASLFCTDNPAAAVRLIRRIRCVRALAVRRCRIRVIIRVRHVLGAGVGWRPGECILKTRLGVCL